MIYTCANCNRRLVTRRDELTWNEIADGAAPVPYLAVIDGHYVCADCVHDHDSPGKFEGHRDRNELGKALILYAMMGDGSYEDDHMSDGWGNYCARIGRYLVMEDDRGFVSFEEFASDALADKRFTELFDDGMGACEDDAYVEHGGWGRFHVSFNGKPLHVWANNFGEITERRCLARVRLEMMRTGYYPNVWIVNDHGNLTLASI